MRDYELSIIVRSDIGDDQIKAAAERVQNHITSRGGQLTNVQQWGRRRLAYQIGHQREGSYFVYRCQMEPEAAAEIEHELNLDEQVLRFIMLYLDRVALEALKNPPAPMQAPERQRPPEPAPAPAAAAAAAPAAASAPAAAAEAPAAAAEAPAAPAPAEEAAAEPAAEAAPEAAAEAEAQPEAAQ